jgi:Uma2 family endonuclease
MVILRCTRELLARLTRSAVEPTASSTTRLGDWYVALVRIGQRQLLLAISERTRLPAIIPARDARGMADPLAGAVGRVLQGIGVPTVEAEVESSAMADAVFAPTRNRSLLGTLNDFTVAIQHHLHSEPDLSLDELAIQLADTPIHTPFHDGAPVDVARRVFGLAAAPRSRLTFDPLASPDVAGRTMPKPRRPPARRRGEPLPMEFALYAGMASVQRCEYLDGAMHVSSSPSPAHQVAVLRIARALEDYFAKADREAIVLAGPVAVFLDVQTVAQPDVVVASRKQLSARGVEGPPRLVVEVVTAASAECDRDVKVRSYAAAGVERYWLVDVDRRTVECLGRRRPPGAATVSLSRGVLAPADVPGFELRLETLWL